MSQIESTFEEDYNDTIAMIEANSSYGILPARVLSGKLNDVPSVRLFCADFSS